MQISGRNQLAGKVTGIKSGGVMSQISLDINGQMVTSAITNDSVQTLGIKEGDQVTALIKATDVMIMK
ncbi:MAG TPA: TOBE domain-containing protein [Bacillota bacterium]|nr:TOBE domain-containing protein [Bacillota bacterium]